MKMDFQTFEKVITTLQAIDDRRHAIHKLGVDILEYDDPHFTVIRHLLEATFGKTGYDIIDWFCCESDYGRNGMTATDKNGNPICRNIQELWIDLQENGSVPKVSVAK